jgi:hypothetical protein
MSILKLWSDLLNYMIRVSMGTREHIGQVPTNKLQGYLKGIANKSHRYVAIIEELNHCLVSRFLGEEDRRTQTIKRSHCSSNEEDNLDKLRKNDTYQRRNILIYYCVFMKPIPIIYT